MRGTVVLIGIAAAVLLMASDAVCAEKVVTVEGVVNDDYQLIADDHRAHNLGYGKESEELAQMIGERARVKGRLMTDSDGMKYIEVISYKTVESKEALAVVDSEAASE